ncbi:MAG TPA: aminotransferase class I/II-fold pyridoxal phosphate-dependent enzyme [Bryobacteraceae bacterium]|nr:aminotransferase class I/II-fold pyridoxal phosphate-dependent enzyme [Bryobacteraceae bacterium]
MPLSKSEEFYRIQKLPPYVFAVVNDMRDRMRADGIDVIDMGMGNPDGATPEPVVQKLIEAAPNPLNHRYSVSRGITDLRKAIVERYQKHYRVALDPESEAIVTMGAKDALAHLLYAIIRPGDPVVSANPAYPLHQFGVVLAEGDAQMLPMPDAATFLAGLKEHFRKAINKPKIILISFPHNPTTICVDLNFMREVVSLAREYGAYVIHDFAYAELGFDGFRPPSILEVEGAKDCAVEIYSMTKSYNMAGWRVGFCLGNQRLVAALTRIKSYLDYGMFQPIQIAAVTALRECHDAPGKICRLYQQRRDWLVEGLHRAGWPVEAPKATMFLWAQLPEALRTMGSLDFVKLVMKDAHVALSPGMGFGPMGEGYVRFSLIEDQARTFEATERIGRLLRDHAVIQTRKPAEVHV